jgi:hypothetical protein
VASVLVLLVLRIGDCNVPIAVAAQPVIVIRLFLLLVVLIVFVLLVIAVVVGLMLRVRWVPVMLQLAETLQPAAVRACRHMPAAGGPSRSNSAVAAARSRAEGPRAHAALAAAATAAAGGLQAHRRCCGGGRCRLRADAARVGRGGRSRGPPAAASEQHTLLPLPAAGAMEDGAVAKPPLV